MFNGSIESQISLSVLWKGRSDHAELGSKNQVCCLPVALPLSPSVDLRVQAIVEVRVPSEAQARDEADPGRRGEETSERGIKTDAMIVKTGVRGCRWRVRVSLGKQARGKTSLSF